MLKINNLDKLPARDEELAILAELPTEQRVRLLEERIRDLEDLITNVTKSILNGGEQ